MSLLDLEQQEFFLTVTPPDVISAAEMKAYFVALRAYLRQQEDAVDEVTDLLNGTATTADLLLLTVTPDSAVVVPPTPIKLRVCLRYTLTGDAAASNLPAPRQGLTLCLFNTSASFELTLPNPFNLILGPGTAGVVFDVNAQNQYVQTQ